MRSGPVTDEAALIAALQQGEICAAGLDVTEVEPTPRDNPLLQMPNVIVTPHCVSRNERPSGAAKARSSLDDPSLLLPSLATLFEAR